MTLPAPNLDDRRFQDLVDDARRYVQRRCPQWSDHNVSDPGITLIETFAMVTDQLLYRLNRVPDRLYLRFLELLGIDMVPPVAARADVTFWLTAPRDDTVTVRAGTEVATDRTETDEPGTTVVAFETVQDLAVLPCSLSAVVTASAGEQPVDRTEQLDDRDAHRLLRRAARARRRDPVRPVRPRCRGAPSRSGWRPRPRAPASTRATRRGAGRRGRAGGGRSASWSPGATAPAGSTGPATSSCTSRRRTSRRSRPGRRAGLAALHAGGPAAVLPALALPACRRAPSPSAGRSRPCTPRRSATRSSGSAKALPGQRFRLGRGPVLGGAGEPLVVEVAAAGSGEDGWRAWERVEHFDASAGTDRHFRLEAATGEIVFGPGVRQLDGTLRQYGAVPDLAAPVRATVYRVGGGSRGNVAAGADHHAAHLRAVRRHPGRQPQARDRRRRRRGRRGGQAAGPGVPADAGSGPSRRPTTSTSPPRPTRGRRAPAAWRGRARSRR